MTGRVLIKSAFQNIKMKMKMEVDVHIIDFPLFTVLLGGNRSVDVIVLEASGLILRESLPSSLNAQHPTLCIIAYLSTLTLRLLALLALLLLRGLHPVDHSDILVRRKLLGLFLCRRFLGLVVLAGGTDGAVRGVRGVRSSHNVVLRRMGEFWRWEAVVVLGDRAGDGGEYSRANSRCRDEWKKPIEFPENSEE